MNDDPPKKPKPQNTILSQNLKFKWSIRKADKSLTCIFAHSVLLLAIVTCKQLFRFSERAKRTEIENYEIMANCCQKWRERRRVTSRKLIAVFSHVKLLYFNKYQLHVPFFSVVEISIKHSSLYNNMVFFLVIFSAF